MEINPRHPVTRAAHDQWHKLCAIVMHKLGVSQVDITAADIEAFGRCCGGQKPALVLREMGRDKVLRLSLMPEAEARRMAQMEDPN